MHSRGPVFSVFGMRVVWFLCCSHEVFNIFLARYVPKILPLPLAYAKNSATNTVLDREISMQPRLTMHQWTIQFFPVWGGREEDFFFSPCFQRVPIKFPKCQSVSNSTEFYPIWFAQVQLPCIYTKKLSSSGINSSLFCNWSPKTCLSWVECPLFQKKAPFKKQEKVVSAPMMESIYQARKVACFVLFVLMRSPNWDASDCVLGLFGTSLNGLTKKHCIAH